MRVERDHPDRLRWNARYASAVPAFRPHQLVDQALTAGLPDGPVLELACGPSGSALKLAAFGRAVEAVDVSDVALGQLAAEARARGLAGRIECVQADVPSYNPGRQRFALVLATYYWDPTAFRSGCEAVAPGGLIGWEALTRPRGGSTATRPWNVAHGDLSARLPAGFDVVLERVHSSDTKASTRLLARQTDTSCPRR